MVDLVLVGCGYAADFYLANIANHPELRFTGVYDKSRERALAFSQTWKLPRFSSLARLLSDNPGAFVLNLTNPESHVSVTTACLEAGHHVYSEKPFAPTVADGKALLRLANRKGLRIASAPCAVLGEAFQTALKLERAGAIGRSRLAIARLHEGAIHLMRHDRWMSASGAVWPAADEFATGCVREHAGYLLDLLVALWGPIRSVQSATAVVFAEKGVQGPVAPDWANAVLRFSAERVAQVSFSIVEGSDHSLTIVGDEGTLVLDDVWRFDSPLKLIRHHRASVDAPHGYRAEPELVPLLAGPGRAHRYTDTHDIDQLRGVADFVASTRAGREARLGGSHALHVLEATLAIAEASGQGTVDLETEAPPFLPPDWAQATSSFSNERE